jgi:saccharopine dehydrogenase-like NADP-dependent oxidoreductase
MPQNLLIIGATGAIGKPIAREIVNSKDSFGRIAVLTSQSTVQEKPSEIDQLKHSGIEILVGDIASEEDVKKAYQSRCYDGSFNGGN